MDILQPETKVEMKPISEWDTTDIPERTMRQLFSFCLFAKSKTVEEAEAKTRTSRKTISSKCRELEKYFGQSVAAFSKAEISITPFGAGLAEAVYPTVMQMKVLIEGATNDFLADSQEMKDVQKLVGGETKPVKKRFSLW